MEFTYNIDCADEIVAVDDNWLDFARHNSAPHLTRDAVERQKIWQFISDPDTCCIYRLLFNAVRTKSLPLTVSYRCDSPTLRRYMELTCRPAPRLGIEIHSRILRQEQRPYVAVLDPRVRHSEAMVTICAWCKKCRVSDDDWREIEDAIGMIRAFEQRYPPQVSHGMCADCHDSKIASIRARLNIDG